MEDDLNILVNGRRTQKEINIKQPKSIQFKINGCGTAPLVLNYYYI